MDRFIEYADEGIIYCDDNLKSSMDRFIAKALLNSNI